MDPEAPRVERSGRTALSRPEADRSVWIDAVLIAAACAAMLVWTWGRWADVFVDFGRELYVPWQLTAGRVLYRDLAYLNGPLSPYWNAAAFRLFGIGMRTLVLVNVVLIAILIYLLYRLLRWSGASRFATTSACIFFALLFGFGTQRVTGNYDNVCPYSHEMTHGTILALLSIFFLAAHLRRARQGLAGIAGRGPLIGAGIAAGLVFLTKPEIFIACAGADLVGLALICRIRRFTGRDSVVSTAAVFAAAAVVPVAVAFVLLVTAMPAAQALGGVLGAWPAVFSGIAERTDFYRGWAGLDAPGAFLGFILRWTLAWGIAFLIPTVVGIGLRGRPLRRALPVTVLIAGFELGGLVLLSPRIEWRHAALPFPIVLLLSIGITGFGLLRKRGVSHTDDAAADGDAGRAIRLMLLIFALLMLIKLGLYPRIFFYGWALGMPAAMLVIVTLIDGLPALAAAKGGFRLTPRVATMAILLVVVLVHLRIIDESLKETTVRVGSGADSFLADARGTNAVKALDAIDTYVGPHETLAVVPEGVMLNYLSRRPNPTPYYTFVPIEMILYGEDRMLASFVKTPPEFVFFAHRPTPEYGLQWAYFSGSYGTHLGDWIADRYDSVERIEDATRKDESFGWMVLLARKGLRAKR